MNERECVCLHKNRRSNCEDTDGSCKDRRGRLREEERAVGELGKPQKKKRVSFAAESERVKQRGTGFKEEGTGERNRREGRKRREG